MILDTLVLPRQHDHCGCRVFHLAINTSHMTSEAFESSTNYRAFDLYVSWDGPR